MQQDQTLSFVIVGHVDHGKSTLIGRLLFDTDSLPPDKIDEIRKASAAQGKQTEFAYLLDHLEEERKQGVTIDTTQVFFKTDKRHYVIIDAPGHVEFVKNMITGATQAEAAVLIVDVKEGIKEQTKRHSYMLSLIGLHQVIVVLNKMDLAGFSQDCFDAVKTDVDKWLESIDIKPIVYIPISAISGDNIAAKSEKMSWYAGLTFLQSLDTLQNRQLPEDKPMLLPVQDVYKIDEKRVNVGRVESGILTENMQIKILPGGQLTKVKTIEKFMEDTTKATASECVGITTSDSVFLDRGNIICQPGEEPSLTDTITASIFWMSNRDFCREEKLQIRCATQQTSCRIESIKKRIDSSTLEVLETNAGKISNLEVGEVIIKTKKPLAVKAFTDIRELGRFVLIRNENICAGGIITAVN